MWLLIPLLWSPAAHAYSFCFDFDYDGWTTCAGDCNDGDSSIYPGAYEYIADGVDSNCDYVETCWVDADTDGWGSGNTTSSSDYACSTANGLSTNPWDCNDGVWWISPSAYEYIADGVDENCDGLELCWQDSDRDTWGIGNIVYSSNT